MVPRCFPCGENTQTPPGPCPVQIAFGVQLHAVRQPVFLFPKWHQRTRARYSRIRPAARRTASKPCVFRRSWRYTGSFRRRKGDAVRPRQIADHSLQLPACETENAVEPQFLLWIVILLEQTVRRIGEVQGSVRRLIYQVIGTVQPFPLEPVYQYGYLAVLTDPHDAPVAVLAKQRGVGYPQGKDASELCGKEVYVPAAK
jgi:hypothetical protein